MRKLKNGKYREWLLAGQHVPLPRHLIIEITSQCNLKCRMCPKTHHAVNTEENKVMSWDIFEKLIELFPYVESLDLSGIWGEAFLHPNLYVDMLRTITANGTHVYTISNGTLITDDLSRQILEFDLSKLVISIDAATPTTYSFIRPPGSFEKVLEGLRRVKWYKEKNRVGHPRVELAFLGMKTNIEEFPHIVRLAPSLGAAQVTLQAMGEYPGMENESIAARDKPLGRRIFKEGQRIGKQLGIKVVLLPEDQFEEDRNERNTLEDTSHHRKQCHDLWNRAVIAATGDVLPCCASPVSMGNLRDMPFDQIWRGPGFSKLREQFLSGRPPKMCTYCTGTAWVEKSMSRELQFYFTSLMFPRLKRRVKQKLKRYPAAQWVKRRWDFARSRLFGLF